MNRKVIFLTIVLFSILSTHAYALSTKITTIPFSPQITVSSQNYVDSYLNWNFTYVNNTQWQANFSFKQPFWGDLNYCLNNLLNLSCFPNLKTTYLPNITVGEALQMAVDLKNLTNYPQKNLSTNIAFSSFQINLTSGTGSFNINFPNGFTTGESAKFGFNSTLINTSDIGNSTFNTYDKAVCNTTNVLHMLFHNTSSLYYYNSTDGVTWNGIRIDTAGADNSSTSSGGTGTIACSGTKVFVAWRTDNSRLIHYRNSSNEGATWSAVNNNWTSSPDATSLLSAKFGSGNNIWLTWGTSGGTLTISNSSSYGGELPTLNTTTLSTGGLNGITASIFVNSSSGTEFIFVTYVNSTCLPCFNSSTNGGSTWTGKNISSGTNIDNLAILEFNNTIYVATAQAGGGNITIYNSTDNGSSWSNALNFAEGTGTFVSLGTDNSNSIFMFYGMGNNQVAGTAQGNVSYRQWNLSNGWSSRIDKEILNSNVSTIPNVGFTLFNGKLPFVFVNRSGSGTAPVDVNYDFLQVTTAAVSNILLTNPANNSNTSNISVYFNYTPQFTNTIKNSSLWINVSGTWAKQMSNGSAVINATNNSLYYNFTSATAYIWNVQVCDTGGTCNFNSTGNFTLTVVPTNILLTSPANNSNTSNISIYFNYTPQFGNAMKNSSLWLNISGTWASQMNNGSVITNATNNSLYYNFTAGTTNLFIWNVQVCDTGGTCNFNSTGNFTVRIDTTPPYFYSETANDSKIYNATRVDWFNVTINDTLLNVSAVIIEFAGQNNTITSNINGQVYYFNRTGLNTGSYNYKWYSNDTVNNWNTSKQFQFSVFQQTGGAAVGGGALPENQTSETNQTNVSTANIVQLPQFDYIPLIFFILLVMVALGYSQFKKRKKRRVEI